MEEVLMPFPRPDKTPPVTMTYFTSNHGIAPSGGSGINFVSRIAGLSEYGRPDDGKRVCGAAMFYRTGA
jgi:hypothetical protein